MNAAGKASTHKVFLGLGSNILPETNMPRAMRMLAEAVEIEEVSSVWESPPVGGEGDNFLNAVALIRARHTPDQLRTQVLRPIEARLGRIRTGNPNAPRPIDLDVLIYDEVPLENLLWEQAHICVPLAELYPGYAKSENGLTLAATAVWLRETSPIRLRTDVHLVGQLKQKRLP